MACSSDQISAHQLLVHQPDQAVLQQVQRLHWLLLIQGGEHPRTKSLRCCVSSKVLLYTFRSHALIGTKMTVACWFFVDVHILEWELIALLGLLLYYLFWMYVSLLSFRTYSCCCYHDCSLKVAAILGMLTHAGGTQEVLNIHCKNKFIYWLTALMMLHRW